MKKEDLFILLCNVLAVDIEEIEMDSDLTEDLNADHTSLVELKLQLEDNIKKTIDQEEYDEVETVEELLTMLDQYDGLDEL